MSLHLLLNLTRPLYVVDTETTGVDTDTDRIIEFGMQQWTAAGMEVEWRTLINPQQEIPAGATKIHGITNAVFLLCQTCNLHAIEHPNEMCEAFKAWPTFRQLAPLLATRLVECDFAGKNVRFDLRIMAAEFTRSQVAWSYSEARIVDGERLEQIVEPRDLSSLHKKYTGMPHDGAHGALSDVRASTTVIAHQLQRYEALPRNLDDLHQLQWPGWITAGGEFRMVDGVRTITFGKHRGLPVSKVPGTYWDYILDKKNKFPEDVRQLAADVKLGGR